MPSFRSRLALVSLLASLAIAQAQWGCQRSSTSGPSDAELRSALVTYADIAEANYADAANGARDLGVAIDALIADPSELALARAREAWLRARVPYAQSEVFRFYDGPIDSVELLVNTWPIDEAYVEAGGAGGQAGPPGIIEDTTRYPELTRELLVRLNTREGETSIATGYHVIEFLLWGRDLRRDGPGERPYTDYVQAAEHSHADSARVAKRRGQYLKLAAELLTDHLEAVADAWSDRSDRRNRAGNYREVFLRKPTREALALLVKGMGSLSGAELAGERLTVAYETKNQENEHSCFSDSTHLDLTGDAVGIQNVCSGHYRRLDGSEIRGTGICALLSKHDAELGRALTAQVDDSVRALKAIPAPFDTAILGTDSAPSRQAVARAIQALQRQTQTLAQFAGKLALTVPTYEARR